MIYFENYRRGTCGLNNHVVPYTFCIALSNFLNREFYFDFEIPSSTPPVFAQEKNGNNKFKILMKSKRSLVSDLLDIPNMRAFTFDQNFKLNNKFRIDDPFKNFVTTESLKTKYENTLIWDNFSLKRTGITKEFLQDFETLEIGYNSLVNASFFFFLTRKEKNTLLKSIEIRYKDEIEKLANKIIDDLGKFNAVHIRLGDFLEHYKDYGYEINIPRTHSYFKETFKNKDFPLLIATDELQDKETFSKLFESFEYYFIDELIFEDYLDDFLELEFTDFNVLSILDQIICANAEVFIGTCRSTFTSIIHRLRQERFKKLDFHFIPDKTIGRILSSENKIIPDSNGFFEWNKYSIFSEYYAYPSWMREWNYDLTSIE